MKRSKFFKTDAENRIIDIDDIKPSEIKYVFYPSEKKRNERQTNAKNATITDDGDKVAATKEDNKNKVIPANQNINDLHKKNEIIVEKNVDEKAEKKSDKIVENMSEKDLIDWNKKAADFGTYVGSTSNSDNIENIKKMDLSDLYAEEDLLFNLNIISELKKSDKLSCPEKLLRIDDPGYTQAFTRWWYGEDRSKTLEKLNQIIDATFSYIDKTYLNELDSENEFGKDKKVLYENNSEKLQKFYLALNNTIRGLEKLKSTYGSDTSMTTGLDLLMGKINTRKEKINKILKIK